MPSHLQAHCPYCGATITVHQKIQPGHCNGPECHKAHAMKGYEARMQAWHDEYKERKAIVRRQVPRTIAALAEECDISQAQVQIAPLPNGHAALTPLSKESRDAYLAHLDQIIAQSFEHPPPTAPVQNRDETAQEAEPDPWNNTACRTCEGQCCASGAGDTHAFQNVELIDHLRQAEPELTPQEIKAHYAQALPELTAHEGCVFQGVKGCVLDRSHRANLCNTFRCYALQRIAAHFDPARTQAILMVSFQGETPLRSNSYSTKRAEEDGAGNPRAAET